MHDGGIERCLRYDHWPGANRSHLEDTGLLTMGSPQVWQPEAIDTPPIPYPRSRYAEFWEVIEGEVIPQYTLCETLLPDAC
jgi:hypothetical protein